MNAYVRYCASIAQKKHDDHVAEEERRLGAAERRANPRGHGRRASDVLAKAGAAPFVVAHGSAEPLYRVLSGRCAGQLVGEDDTCECDRELGGCDGSGKDGRGEECRACGGVGRVLGYPDVGAPVRLELVEGSR